MADCNSHPIARLLSQLALSSNICAAPENILTNPAEGHCKLWDVGGLIGVKSFKGKSNQKIFCEEGTDIF